MDHYVCTPVYEFNRLWMFVWRLSCFGAVVFKGRKVQETHRLELVGLVGLEDLGHRHRKTQRLAQVHVLLPQRHQTAAKEVLVLLHTHGKTNPTEPSS